MSSVINDTLLAIKSAFEAGVNIFNGGTAVSSSNPLPVAQTDGLSVSGTATSAVVLFTTSMVNYESITVQVTNAGVNCTVTYEQSEDQTIWYTVSGISVTNSGQSAPSSGTSSVAMYIFPRRSTYFRARVHTYGSGTVALTGALSKTPVNLTIEARLSGYANEGAAIINQPVPICLEGRTSSKTSVTSGQAVRPIATTDGRLVTRLNSIPENEWQYAAASGGITNTTDVALVAAQGAGIKNYLTGLSVANASATATEVVVKDGSTVIWRSYVAANLPLKDIPFPTPLQSTANAALNVACITTGTQTYISAQGYKAP
jgi:hypothetical protein